VFLFTGSVVVPVKALAMNVLSLGASSARWCGSFQEGHLGGLVGTQALGSLSVTTPVLVLAIAFGLSMDYEVFLLGPHRRDLPRDRRQRPRRGGAGAAQPGRVVTAAALLMAIVFAGFVAGGFSPVKQVGLGLLLAVVVDATLVRMLLLPAVMGLMGRANWWAPAPLRRLHDRIGLQERAESTQPGAGKPPVPGSRFPLDPAASLGPVTTGRAVRPPPRALAGRAAYSRGHERCTGDGGPTEPRRAPATGPRARRLDLRVVRPGLTGLVRPTTEHLVPRSRAARRGWRTRSPPAAAATPPAATPASPSGCRSASAGRGRRTSTVWCVRSPRSTPRSRAAAANGAPAPYVAAQLRRLGAPRQPRPSAAATDASSRAAWAPRQ
jgi:hypothetical protein